MSAETPAIESVRGFWQNHPCGTENSAAADRLRYFQEVEAYRYRVHSFLPRVARFDGYRGKRVLEIGCGMGIDGCRFAAGGAIYTGVDLTNAAVQLTRENLGLRGLPGAAEVANAEHLPFSDGTFDHVYSFGVIHHTTNPAAAVTEILRVLKPGGTVTVMLYNRTSVNYYLEIMGLRRAGRALLRPRFAPGLIAKLLRLPREKLEGHRRQLLRIPYPTREQWISMNTDGPDCPLARVYSKGEVQNLFSSFGSVCSDVHFFDATHWGFLGRLIPPVLSAVIGERAGWHRMVYATKHPQ
jgi:2-polyprenyl-3-methyl-5-hydroxy-6-metoxy-1,4-benzoquinol methylase